MAASAGTGAGGGSDVAREAEKPYDRWRDGPLRYLGYANEVGESFKPLVPKLLVPSYIVSGGYVLIDSYDKGTKTFHDTTKNQNNKHVRTLATVLDTFIWQGLASVAVPGFTINRVVRHPQHTQRVAVHFSKKALAKQAVSPVVKQWGPTLLGLAVIPLIVHPIDWGVDQAMDVTVRPLLSYLVDEAGTEE